jgi:hypothetical protein
MGISPKLGLLLAVLTGFSLPAPAIIVADYSVAISHPTNAPSGDWGVNWDYVYKYKNSSAVAVGPHWLLTAAHVADDGVSATVVVNGTNYYQQEIIFHAAADDPEHTNRADLALVRFDKAFPGSYPLYTGTFPRNPPGSKLNAVMIGYGRTGTVFNSYYTEAPGGNGVKRWGSQKIDETETAAYDVGGTTGLTENDGIIMQFDLSDTPYETGVGVYDSGGGCFIKDGGVWKLAGINTTREGTAPNYTGTFAVSMPAYETWATNVMNPAGDLDGDGLPNYWEQRYGTTTGLVASVDNDSDGFINADEYVADTDPTNAASFFEISGFLALTNQTVTFIGSTGRQYQVFYTTNDLTDANLTWIAAHTNWITGAGANSSITVTNTASKAFFRLRATLFD